MQEAPATEVSAAKAREHLIAFVEEMVAGLPHVRQRKNALLYVRGLIEHGGRKSPQPTLLRLGENAARYESVQQFLADSPWDAGLLVRACAERVTAELGLAAWVVDDTGVVKDGHRSPRVKRQYSATLGKIGSCQILDDSMKTSVACSSRARTSRPSGAPAFNAMVRWLRRSRSPGHSVRIPSGKRGFSIQTTPAPKSAMSPAAKGPATVVVACTTLRPARTPNCGFSALRVTSPSP